MFVVFTHSQELLFQCFECLFVYLAFIQATAIWDIMQAYGPIAGLCLHEESDLVWLSKNLPCDFEWLRMYNTFKH